MSRVTRMWPLALAVFGIGALTFSAYRLVSETPPEDDGVEAPPDPRVLDEEHFHTVRELEIDVYSEVSGRLQVEGTHEVRAPQGMRVPIVKIHKEHGDFVEKGEILITFAREKIEKAIEEAKAAGRTGDVARFESYLEFAELRSPFEGQVLDIWPDIGSVPLDRGIPLMTLTDRSSWSFVCLVPEDVTRTVGHIGAELTIELEHDLGEVRGVVNTHGRTSEGNLATVGGYVQLVIGLEPHPGLEKDVRGKLRIPTSKRTIALVPRSAVRTDGEDGGVIRVWEDGEVLERTVKLGGEHLDDYKILYGVSPGESVVVPGPAPEE